MPERYEGSERRFFLRFDYEKPVHFRRVRLPRDENPVSSFIKAVSKNLSVAGVFFVTGAKNMPEIYSLIMLDIDYKMSHVCEEIESRALIINNKLLARVVRVENNKDGTYGVGVAFVTKEDPLSEELQKRTQ